MMMNMDKTASKFSTSTFVDFNTSRMTIDYQLKLGPRASWLFLFFPVSNLDKDRIHIIFCFFFSVVFYLQLEFVLEKSVPVR